MMFSNDAVRTFWPILAALFGATGPILYWWLRTKFTTRQDHDVLADKVAVLGVRVDDSEDRLIVVEEHCKQSPTRQELQNDISMCGAEVAGLKSEVGGLSKRIDTLNDYIHALIEQGLRK